MAEELLLETVSGNEDAVVKALDASHINVTSNRSYNNEDALQSAIYWHRQNNNPVSEDARGNWIKTDLSNAKRRCILSVSLV